MKNQKLMSTGRSEGSSGLGDWEGVGGVGCRCGALCAGTLIEECVKRTKASKVESVKPASWALTEGSCKVVLGGPGPPDSGSVEVFSEAGAVLRDKSCTRIECAGIDQFQPSSGQGSVGS